MYHITIEVKLEQSEISVWFLTNQMSSQPQQDQQSQQSQQPQQSQQSQQSQQPQYPLMVTWICLNEMLTTLTEE